MPCESALRSVVVAVGLVAMAHGQAPAGSRAPAASLTLPAEITSLTAVNGSATVLAGLEDGQIAVWNGRDTVPAIVLKAHGARVVAVASTSDGRDAISIAADGSLARTQISAGAAPASRRLDVGAAQIRAAAFSSDGSTVVTGSEFGEMRVFDTGSGRLRHRLPGHRTELHYVTARPGSSIVASASAEADLRIWDVSAGRQLAAVDGDLALFALSFSPRDGSLAAGGVDRRLTFRDAATFKPQRELVLKAPQMVLSVAWSPDGRLIAFGDLDDATLSKGGLQLLDASTRAVVATLDTGGRPAAALAFAGEAGTLIAAVGRDLRAWPLAEVK